MKKKNYFVSFLIGITNVLIGSGGGIIAVGMLKNEGLSQKEAQSTAIACMLPLTLASVFLYLKNRAVDFSSILPYLPFGIIGAVCGAKTLKKISPKILSLLFSAFLIYSSIRLFFK